MCKKGGGARERTGHKIKTGTDGRV